MEAGTIIGERYVLDQQIGEGGMAAVWLAEDRTLRRMVAIKFLWAKDERGAQELAKSFLREARLAASVHHPNVVQVLDFGLHAGERPYMVMEALDGESLGDQFNAGKLYTLEQVAHIGGGALEGLMSVHDAGIVHRDLKPENIFLVSHHNRLQAKLLDFGISRVVSDATGLRSAVSTVDGHVVGTPEYMSPEQARGLHDVDSRADIYAMGVILYEMVAGDVPYKDDAFGDLLMKVAEGGARTVHEVAPSVPEAFSDVIAVAMSRERELRYQTAAEMYDALMQAARPYLTGEPVTLELPRRPERRLWGPPASEREEEKVLAGPERSARISLLTEDELLKGLGERSGASTAPPAPSSKRLWIALGVFAAIVLAGVYALRTATPDPPRYIVVQASGEEDSGETPSQAGTAEAQPAPAPAPEPTPTPEAAPEPTPEATPEPEAEPRPAPTKAGKPASQSAQLAAAFKRQKGTVIDCFTRHPEGTLAEVAVRVSVEPSGAVSRAEVQPSSAAGTPAGKCVVSAVERMRFPKQPSPVSFKVPLHLRRR